MRPVTRRFDPNDLETARRMVSRAERKALERAEQLWAEAESLLRSASERAVETERTIREGVAAELRGLREELDAASRRATRAESELDLLRNRPGPGDRAGHAGADEEVPTLRTVATAAPTDGGADDARLSDPVRVAALRAHARAELELVRAREEAVRILAMAAAQAEDLLSTAVSAVERDGAIAAATRRQAERDGEEAARVLRDAAREAEGIIAEAQREAAATSSEVRRKLVEEILSLRDAMVRTRASFDSFLEAAGVALPAEEAADADGTGEDRRREDRPAPHPEAAGTRPL